MPGNDPEMSKEQKAKASAKIRRMTGKKESRPKAQIVAIGIKMAREGKLGPTGGAGG